MGKVYLVGAGPGDPQLITVKGLELIKKADVIIYDFLVNEELLTFAKEDAEFICAGKSPLHHTMEQDEINSLLAAKAREVDTVVRLKNGDPFIFGRGAEEAVYLAERNIPFHLVPGISSATAVPALCGIPLTHRNYASSVGIITGHRKNDEAIKSVTADTLVFLMAAGNLESITRTLIRGGRQPDTPCILIERGTFDNQKIVSGRLENIAERSRSGGINPPAVFVVGRVVNLRKILKRKKILFTGTSPERFRNLGEILHQPMIKIIPLDDYSGVEEALREIDKYDWIIFTSRYGVRYFFDILNKTEKKIGRIRICAIGKATANELRKYGKRADYTPQEESSRGIVKMFENFDLKGKNVLIPRSNLSSNYLPAELGKMGAYVNAIEVYENVKPSGIKKIDLGGIDEIIFTSPSTVENFISEYKDIPEGVRLKCIGDVTHTKLEGHGFHGEIIDDTQIEKTAKK